MDNQTVLERLKTRLGDTILESHEFRGELTVVVPKEKIVDVCTLVKNDPELAYDFLSDLCGFDMYTPSKRFGVVYNVLSLRNRHRFRIKIFTDEEDLKVPTVTGVWRAADCAERETFDMFGIVFEGHPDLRRMYMPEDFEYFPLRKDFPLMGIPGSLPLPKK
ncbi:MAG TPA: NADH-quinone oxidoreductase subunit C [Bacteroidota bacterium]